MGAERKRSGVGLKEVKNVPDCHEKWNEWRDWNKNSLGALPSFHYEIMTKHSMNRCFTMTRFTCVGAQKEIKSYNISSSGIYINMSLLLQKNFMSLKGLV